MRGLDLDWRAKRNLRFLDHAIEPLRIALATLLTPRSKIDHEDVSLLAARPAFLPLS